MYRTYMNDKNGRAARDPFCNERRTLHCNDAMGLRPRRGPAVGVGCSPARDRDAGFCLGA